MSALTVCNFHFLMVVICSAVCWIGAAALCLGLLLLTVIMVAHSKCTDARQQSQSWL